MLIEKFYNDHKIYISSKSNIENNYEIHSLISYFNDSHFLKLMHWLIFVYESIFKQIIRKLTSLVRSGDIVH